MKGWDVPQGFNFARDVVEPLAADPNRRALTHVDPDGVIQRFTFAEVAIEASRWAWLLRTQGYMPGDRVLVLLGKVPAWLGVMLGAMKGGLVTVPCSELLRARDLAFRAQHARASLLVADRSAQPEVDSMRGMLDRPIDVLYLDDASLLLQRQPTSAPTEVTKATDPAFLLYTSGTTHEPKGVVHTHAYAWAKRMQAEHWLGARPGDLVWCTAGTGWAKSIWNVLLGPWSRGAETVMHEGGFDAEQRFELIERLGVTILCQAPTEYRLMAKSDTIEGRAPPRLRHAVSAGEPLNPEVIERFRDALGVTIYDGYGQTENTLLVANTRDHDLRPGSMGLATPGHRVAVIDEAGAEVEPGVEGDIALAGRPPSLFDRYWDAPEETAAVFRGDWYVTGDRASRDEDGYFWFAGRADDVIISAGYRIGPFEVESALLEHPAVAESAAVAKPNPDRGHIVKAFVVLRPGHEPGDALAHELQEHAKRVTAPYKYPREVEFVTELPKTRSGKIRRAELRSLELERAAAAPAAPVVPSILADPPAETVQEEAVELVAAREAEEAARRWADEEAARQRAADDEAKRARAERESREAAVAADAERRRRETEARRQAATEKATAKQLRKEEQEARKREEEARRKAEAERRKQQEIEEKAAEQQRRQEAEERKREEERRRKAAEADRRQAAEDERRRLEEERKRREEAERLAREQAERQRADKRRGGKRVRPEPEPVEEPEPVSNQALLQRLQRYGMRAADDSDEGGDDAAA